jgi:hypothetical protein
VGRSGGEGRWAAAGLKGQMGRLAAGPKMKEKFFSEYRFDFLNILRLWKFVEGDFGGILT